MTVQLPRLTIITLNCRGIRDDVRRRNLFYHLRYLELYSGQVQKSLNSVHSYVWHGVRSNLLTSPAKVYTPSEHFPK